jgi:spermidine synthase
LRVRGAFVLIFFLSGACALVYEVSWIRLFAVALGASAYSLCAVLAGFMAGLALGGAVAGRTADARRDPLRLYAVLELAISVLGFLSPEILEWLSRTLAPHLADPGMPMALRAVARFAVVAVVLVLPTSLMGATLPVLARGCVPEKDEVGAETARLYSANTLGAALGAFLAGFVLLPVLGLRATLRWTAAVNAALGAAALALGRRQPPRLPVVFASDGPRERRLRDPLTLAVAALSGFIALSYEVLWTRLLTFFVGWTVYAYATMLAAFLLGLGLGSALFRSLGPNRGRAWRRVALLQLGTGFAAAASVPSLRLLTPFMERCLEAGYGGTFDQRVLLKFVAALVVMLPSCVLLGATFPATVEAAGRISRNPRPASSAIRARRWCRRTRGSACSESADAMMSSSRTSTSRAPPAAPTS